MTSQISPAAVRVHQARLSYSGSLLFDGLSYREMGEELAVKEGALRVRVLRCRKKAIEVREELLGQET